MAEEPLIGTSNSSQLLQSNSSNHSNGNNIDDLPVGGSKFNFSQYPSQNEAPIQPKKPVVKKASKQSKKEEISKQNVQYLLQKNEQAIVKNSQPLDQIPVGGNNNLSFNPFDEKPAKSGNNTNMSEFPDGDSAPVTTQTNYTMTQMLKSKANKLKLSGMEALLKMLEQDENNSELQEVNIGGLLKQTVPANLQKILQCFSVWMKKGRSWGEQQIRNIVEYGHINGKVNNKKQAIEMLDQIYEEKPNDLQIVLLMGFKSKIPKNIAGYNAVLNELIAIYGAKRFKYFKPYIPEVVRVISNQKLLAVKNQGMITLKEACKWMTKEFIQPQLKDLKEGLKKQLDSFWETYDKTIVMSAPKDIVQTGGKNQNKKGEIYNQSEAVDVFKKYSEKWSETVLKAPKWNEKTKMIQEFIKDASVIKIANTDFRPVAQVIRRLINDSNFNVVLGVLKMIGVVAKGLRKPFSAVVRSNFSNIISKFKDKKTQMIQQTFKTLTDITYSIGIEQVLQDVKEGLQEKNPNMKINLINWISKYVEQKIQDTGGQCPQKTKDSLKQLFSIFQKLISDSDLGVRQAMAKNIAKLQYFLGQEFFALLKSKIKIKLPGSQIKYKQPPSNLKKEDKEINNKPTTQTLKLGSKPNLPTPTSVKGGSKVITIPEKEPIKTVKILQCFDQPTYEGSLQTLINLGYPQQEIKKITSSNANDRSLMLNYFRQNPYQCLNQILRTIRKAYKDWKEVNLNLNKDLISYLEQRKSDLNKPEIYVIIPYIVEKFGDNKFTEGLTNIVENACSRLPPKFIVGHILRYTKSTQGKRPKLNAEVCSLLIKIIEIVSIVNVDLKQIVQYAKQTYVVPFSKKGAASLLVFIYSYIGEEIKSHLQESTFKAMENQFKTTKSLTQEQKKPKVLFEGEAAFECVTIQKKISNKGNDKTKDISVQIIRLLPKLNDNGNWQNRKSAAEELSSMIQQNGKVNFGNPTDLLSILKSRINDPNKQLIKVFVHLAGLVLCALPEKQLKNWSKNFINAFLDGLNDKNEVNKKLIHTTLAKLGDVIGKQMILSSLGPYLQGQKEGRLEVISLALNLEEAIAKADIRDYPKGLTNCLTDKNKFIREKAQKLFEKVYEKIGLQQFKNIAKNSKTAVEKDLTQFLNKFDKNASSIYINSRGSSPNNKDAKQPRPTFQPPINSGKSTIKPGGGSISKVNSKSNLFNKADQQLGSMTGSFYLTGKKCLVEGNEIFPNLKTLSAQRAQRVSNQEAYQWRLDDLREHNQQNLKEDIEKLFRADLAKKMLSFDYKRVMEVVIQLMKLSKDITYQIHIRQLYDILLKWILIRLWGGNSALISTIELIAPILSILQKKKLAMTEFQVDLVIVVIRQYLFSALLVGNSFSQSLYNIIKCLVTLSSGQKVLKKVLKQFTVEPSSIHKHLKRQNGIIYRQALRKLVKHQLVDYVGNEDTLEEASKVKQLKQDNQFVQMLSRRLHQNVLSLYGFKRISLNSQPPINKNNQVISANYDNKKNSNNNIDKSLERPSASGLIPKNDPRASTTGDLRPSKLPASGIKTPFAKKSDVDSSEYKGQTLSKKSQNMAEITSNSYEPQFLDLSIYLCPHPASPLGKQLSKLLPPNQQTIQFFNTLFQETSQKIINQLSNHAKFIFGSILKSVQSLLSSRKQYQPDKIVAQITLLQNCIKCNHVIKNIDELLGFGTSFALIQLVYEDQHKSQIYEELKSRNIQYRSDQFIKAINGVMLRLLEFANSQDIVNVILELLTVYSRATNPSSKIISLIVKCLGRVAPGFVRDLKQSAAKKFLIRANEYFCSIEYQIPLEKLDTTQKQQSKQKIRNEDSAANAIKAILIELCNKMNSEIWDVYQKAMMQSKFSDKLISNYLHSLNIKQPERRQKSHIKQNEQLKKINQLLSKNKSYQMGIAQLKKYIEAHPNFSPYEYFTSLNYDQKFIAMVIRTIDGRQQQQRLAPSKQREEPQSNIQDKIQKLKQRYENLQPQGPQQISNGSMVRGRGGGQQQLRQEKALQIKRRIEEMKSRMNSTINRGQGRQ